MPIQFIIFVYRPYMTMPTMTMSTTSAAVGTATYNYTQEPYFYNLQDRNLSTYQERLRERSRSRADML